MALNNSHEGVMDRRRSMVARLLLRGLTQREIQAALAGPDGIRNGEGRPWSIATVNRDVQAVKLAWQREYTADYQSHVARMLAEYREVRREAWRGDDLKTVLVCCQAECKLLGLDRPDRLVVSWRQEVEEAGLDAGEIFEQLVAAVALGEGQG